MPGRHQVRAEKANIRELPSKCRKNQDDVEIGVGALPRDEHGGHLSTGHAASGIEVARARSGPRRGTAGTFVRDVKGKAQVLQHEADSTNARSRDGAVCMSDEGAVMALEQRDRIIGSWLEVNPSWG